MGKAERNRRLALAAPPPPPALPKVILELAFEEASMLYDVVGERLRLLDLQELLEPRMMYAGRRANLSLLQVRLNTAMGHAQAPPAPPKDAPAP